MQIEVEEKSSVSLRYKEVSANADAFLSQLLWCLPEDRTEDVQDAYWYNTHTILARLVIFHNNAFAFGFMSFILIQGLMAGDEMFLCIDRFTQLYTENTQKMLLWPIKQQKTYS